MRLLIEAYRQIHAEGITHRFVTPKNIGVTFNKETKQNIVRLCGFAFPFPTCDNEICWKAPENVEQYDYPADIFSLGSIFYFMLNFHRDSNDRLFPNSNSLFDANFDNIRLQKLGTLMVDEINRDLIEKMTRQDPSQRFTAEQLKNHQAF